MKNKSSQAEICSSRTASHSHVKGISDERQRTNCISSNELDEEEDLVSVNCNGRIAAKRRRRCVEVACERIVRREAVCVKVLKSGVIQMTVLKVTSPKGSKHIHISSMDRMSDSINHSILVFEQ